MEDYANLLNEEFAQQICDIFREETSHPIIMVNKEGLIFAATERKRIGTFHAIGKKVMDGELAEGVITLEDEKRIEGVKAGINIPIVYKGQRVSGLGIGGDPDVVRPLLGIAARTILLWLQNEERLQDLTKTMEMISRDLHEIAATVQQVSAGSQQVATSSEITYQIAAESTEKVKNVENVLKMIKHIASQSNLIGLNAAIEAARVGEAGRGFAVVANEVRKLAHSSDKSVEDIAAVLNQIQEVFADIANKVEENNEVNREQSVALQSISENIASIERNMSSLVGRMREA